MRMILSITGISLAEEGVEEKGRRIRIRGPPDSHRGVGEESR